jgi:hypothetical protein
MSSATPDYQALYEKALLEKEAALVKAETAQQKQQQAEAMIGELTQKLTLSLFEIDRLRRKLFGTSSDNRTKYIDPNQIALFDLQMSEQERQTSEEQTNKEVAQAKQDIEKTQKPALKKREKIPGWSCLLTFPVKK